MRLAKTKKRPYQSLVRERQADDTRRRIVEAARQLLQVGESHLDSKLDPAELAAWTMVSRTVLNMDETITKQ